MSTFWKSIALFVACEGAAGLCEIGEGNLVSLWLREQREILLGAIGGLALFLYGVLPTLQPAHFGRVYAAYKGSSSSCRSCGLVERRLPPQCP